MTKVQLNTLYEIAAFCKSLQHVLFLSCCFSTFQLWVAYAPCSSQHKDAVQVTLEQIDLIKRLVITYPNQLELVKTSQGKKLCDYYLDNARIVQDEWISKDWITNHLSGLNKDSDIRYINKFSI